MKTFKQFIDPKKEKVPSADYYPSHGSHAQEKVPSANYYPSHGSHAHEKGKGSIKEEAKKITHSEFTEKNPNEKVGREYGDVHYKLNPSNAKWSKLPKYEREAAHEYTSGSRATNKELIDIHHGKPSNFKPESGDDNWTRDWKKDNEERHNKIVKGLDSLLNRSRVPRNLTVFHGINAVSSERFNPGELASQHSERHIHMPAYISTSVDPHYATSFAKPIRFNRPVTTHMLRIHLKRGQKGFRYVGDQSAIPEREGILARGKTLKIGEHPTIVHHEPTGGQIHVWDAHVVD